METCEVCPSQSDKIVKFMGMKMCPDCYQKELALQDESARNAESRVKAVNETATINQQVNLTIERAKQIDSAITVRTDIFNAETVSIDELCKAIDNDESIINKQLKKAEILKERFDHFKSVIFTKQNEIVDIANQANAVQTYLNNLANTLRREERERLKLIDINYQPAPVKAKVARISTKKNKIDKDEVKRVAQQCGVPESVITMICVARNCSPQIAAQSLVDAADSVK